MAGIEDPVVALDFDLAAMVRLLRNEIEMTEKALEAQGFSLPAQGRARKVEW